MTPSLPPVIQHTVMPGLDPGIHAVPHAPASPVQHPTKAAHHAASQTPSANGQLTLTRHSKGRTADTAGRQAEHQAATALEAEGWTILARRLRTPAGELDLIAERNGLLAIIEVKSRPTLAAAATSLQLRQQRRIMAAAEIALAANPAWGRAGVRFDLILVDPQGQVRRIADAFRVDS